MIYAETGKIDLGKGKELFPGMTKEDFFNSKLFKEELIHESDKQNKAANIFTLKVQKLYNKAVIVTIYFALGLVKSVEIESPDMLNYSDWTDDPDYQLEKFKQAKLYVDDLLSKTLDIEISSERLIDIGFEKSWGSLNSLYDIKTPNIYLEIEFDLYSFAKIDNYDKNIFDLLINP